MKDNRAKENTTYTGKAKKKDVTKEELRTRLDCMWKLNRPTSKITGLSAYCLKYITYRTIEMYYSKNKNASEKNTAPSNIYKRFDSL